MRKMLSAAFVRNIDRPGKYGDLHGLILRVRQGGSKYWFWRGSVRGKRVDYRIGSYPYVTLAEAPETAFEYRKVAKAGGDPKALKDVPTFAAALEKVIAIHRPTWKPGGRTEKQWRSEMATYALRGERPGCRSRRAQTGQTMCYETGQIMCSEQRGGMIVKA